MRRRHRPLVRNERARKSTAGSPVADGRPRRRPRDRGAGDLRRRRKLLMGERRLTRSPDSQAPPDRAPQRLVHGFAGEPDTLAYGFGEDLATRLATHRCAENAPSTTALSTIASRVRASRIASRRCRRDRRSSRSRTPPWPVRPGGQASVRYLPGNLDRAQRCAAYVCKEASGARAARLLEDEIVAFETEPMPVSSSATCS